MLKKLSNYSTEIKIAFLALFFLIVGANTQTGWLYILSALVGSLLLTGWVSSRGTLKGIAVKRLPIAPTLKGKDSLITISVSNESTSDKRNILIKESIPEELRPELPLPEILLPDRRLKLVIPFIPALSSVTVSYTIPAKRRGLYYLDNICLIASVPFGMFPYQTSITAHDLLEVYPVGPQPSRSAYCGHRDLLEDSVIRQNGEGQDFYGLRNYTTGEDIRYIHWPTSAKYDRLMIRQFHETGAPQYSVVLCNCAPYEVGDQEDPGLEAAISLAASLAKLRCEHGVRVSFLALSHSAPSEAHTTDDSTAHSEHRSQQAASLHTQSGPFIVSDESCSESQALHLLASLETLPETSLEPLLQAQESIISQQGLVLLLTTTPNLRPELLARFLPNSEHCRIVFCASYPEQHILSTTVMAPAMTDYQDAAAALSEQGYFTIIHRPEDNLGTTLGQML